MDQFKVVDKGSLIFYAISIAVISLFSYYDTGKLWQSIAMGIISGALLWVTYLTFRCIHQAFKDKS